MMHKFSKTGEYAKKRLKIALAEDRSTISASDNMAQIKKVPERCCKGKKDEQRCI